MRAASCVVHSQHGSVSSCWAHALGISNFTMCSVDKRKPATAAIVQPLHTLSHPGYVHTHTIRFAWRMYPCTMHPNATVEDDKKNTWKILCFPKKDPFFINIKYIKLIRWRKILKIEPEVYQQPSVLNFILCLLIQVNHFIRLINC